VIVSTRAIIVCAALALGAPACTQKSETPVVQARWSEQALEALTTIARSASAEGLPSEQSAIEELAHFRQRAGAQQSAADQLAIAADTLHDRLARTYAQGAVDPAVVDPQWRIPRPSVPDIQSPLGAKQRRASDVSALRLRLPQSEEYGALRAELARVMREAPETSDAQGRSREARLSSLRASLERWRWLPREWAPARVEVRIAQFRVLLHQPDSPPRSYAAIVGARGTQTPTFAAEIRGATLNPAWTPPTSILAGELLPGFRRNPSAASRSGYDVINAAGATVDPTNVDWSARPFPYRLRQRPGPGNALGRIKFEMPNPYHVYLHDTPSRDLFARDQRALSHGCVRVERPVDLAEALLGPTWSAATLEDEIDRGRTRTVLSEAPIPVFILYLTATSDNGVVHYADDLYGRDASLIAALDAPDVTHVAATSPATSPQCAGPG
jgi:L,D-transpeptidase YcbB